MTIDINKRRHELRQRVKTKSPRTSMDLVSQYVEIQVQIDQLVELKKKTKNLGAVEYIDDAIIDLNKLQLRLSGGLYES
mgnify:FL=1